IAQVLTNLLSNAVKFTSARGRIHVRLRQVGTRLEVSVADTGEGMDPAFLPHIFDSFRQADASRSRKHGGLGLGLALVKQLTELHGGTVEARSDGIGKGSTFLVNLPLIGSELLRSGTNDGEEAPEQRDFDLAGLRVLLLDDDPDSVEMQRRLLEGCRAEV